MNLFMMKSHGIRSNDGILYTKQQWKDAYELVVNHLLEQGHQKFDISFWEVTGAIAGWAGDKPFEFYMRDLVRGIVRDANLPEAHQEYQAEVNKSGWENFD